MIGFTPSSEKKSEETRAAVQLLGIAGTGQTEGVDAGDRHRRESVIVLLTITKVGIGQRSAFEVRLVLMERYNLLRVVEGQAGSGARR